MPRRFEKGGQFFEIDHGQVWLRQREGAVGQLGKPFTQRSDFPDWGASQSNELIANRLKSGFTEVPAPALDGTGAATGSSDAWLVGDAAKGQGGAIAPLVAELSDLCGKADSSQAGISSDGSTPFEVVLGPEQAVEADLGQFAFARGWFQPASVAEMQKQWAAGARRTDAPALEELFKSLAQMGPRVQCVEFKIESAGVYERLTFAVIPAPPDQLCALTPQLKFEWPPLRFGEQLHLPEVAPNALANEVRQLERALLSARPGVVRFEPEASAGALVLCDSQQLRLFTRVLLDSGIAVCYRFTGWEGGSPALQAVANAVTSKLKNPRLYVLGTFSVRELLLLGNAPNGRIVGVRTQASW